MKGFENTKLKFIDNDQAMSLPKYACKLNVRPKKKLR